MVIFEKVPTVVHVDKSWGCSVMNGTFKKVPIRDVIDEDDLGMY